jgi:hypothetical protein
VIVGGQVGVRQIGVHSPEQRYLRRTVEIDVVLPDELDHSCIRRAPPAFPQIRIDAAFRVVSRGGPPLQYGLRERDRRP